MGYDGVTVQCTYCTWKLYELLAYNDFVPTWHTADTKLHYNKLLDVTFQLVESSSYTRLNWGPKVKSIKAIKFQVILGCNSYQRWLSLLMKPKHKITNQHCVRCRVWKIRPISLLTMGKQKINKYCIFTGNPENQVPNLLITTRIQNNWPHP